MHIEKVAIKLTRFRQISEKSKGFFLAQKKPMNLRPYKIPRERITTASQSWTADISLYIHSMSILVYKWSSFDRLSSDN